jgi:hypothetical protein
MFASLQISSYIALIIISRNLWIFKRFVLCICASKGRNLYFRSSLERKGGQQRRLLCNAHARRTNVPELRNRAGIRETCKF